MDDKLFALKSKNWSAEVSKNSLALDLEEGVFTWDDPKKIAASLKRNFFPIGDEYA